MPTEAELETAQKRLFKRYVWFTLLALFFVVGLFLLLGFASANASADTHTWISDGAANSDSAAAWDVTAAPEAGDDLAFNSAHTGTCTINQALTFGTITLGAGSGTVTQGAVDFGYSDFSMAGGTWTGVTTNWQTCSGNWIQTGGTVAYPYCCLKMTGATAILTTSNYQWKLWVTGGVTIATVDAKLYTGSLVVSAGATISIPTGRSLIVAGAVSGTIGVTLDGVISGAGTLKLGTVAADNTISSSVTHTVNIIYMEKYTWNASPQKNTLLSSFVTTGAIIVWSETSGQTGTLDIAGYSLSATTITAGTRGIISSSVAGAKITASATITVSANGQLDATNIAWISCGTNWDSSAGTWTPGTNQVNMTSVYKAVKLAAGQTFYDLQLINNTNVTGQASVTHLIKYSGMGANLHYHWLNATSIGDYQSNASGLIDIAGRILYVANLYRMEVYFLPPTITNTAPLSILIYHTYYYNATADQPGTWSIVEGASWLTESTFHLTGMPDRTQLAPVPVQVTLSNINGTAYYNFTVTPYGWAATFTTTAPTVLLIGETYIYYPQSNTSTTLSIVTYPAWMSLVGGDHLTGMGVYPGNYSISIRTNCSGGLYAYQNYTVSVFASSMVLTNPAGMDVQSIMFIVMLVLLTAVSFLDKRVMFLGGMLWMCGSLFVWYDLYSFMFYIGIGAGLYFLLNGAMEYV